MRLVVVTLLQALLAAAPAAGHAQEISPEFRTDALELMEMTGAAQLGGQMGTAVGQQMIVALQRARPDIPPRAFEIVSEVVADQLAAGLETELLDDMVNVYAAHFTLEDVRGLIEFYKTPLGKKTIAVMPAVMVESMQTSQAWAAGRVPAIEAEIDRRLREEGILR